MDTLLEADICVYGATAAGCIAAITAKNRGRSVILLHPGKHIGGMTTGGLSWTDIGNKKAIGGLSREFYRRTGSIYGIEEAWIFEPRVAEGILMEWLRKRGIEVRFCQYLDSVTSANRSIEELRFLGGLRVRSRVFVDATYEGDLMASAGVDYAVGRESNSQYGETHNGVQILEKHQFDCPVSPFVVAGDADSGLLPGIDPGQPENPGSGDSRIQAFNFRVCMTDDPSIRLPFPKPDHFDPKDYELASRWLQCTQEDVFHKFDLIRPNKTDTNNNGAVSTDFIGANYQWPEADYETREEIFQHHVAYQQGLHWFMANDNRVPETIREEYARWGLAKDEFTDTANWPHQLYIREARRMISDYVMTENDCIGKRRCNDPAGMAAYQMDSHNCARIVVDGQVKNEGDVQVKLTAPFPISTRSMLPGKGQCGNLFVPVCISASHIAFGSIRMEPVFMILGQSAAIAADLALEEDMPVQSIPYEALKGELLGEGQILETESGNTGSINPHL